jgi:hypothetical protein
MRLPLLAMTLFSLVACKRHEPVPVLPEPEAETATAEDSVAEMAEQHQAAGAGPAETGPIKVAKAKGSNAKTVAEVWAERALLKGREVTVQAQIVKFTPGVMERNWLHVRDGTGSRATRDNDLTVTTLDEAKPGDVVTVRGIVGVDRDIGSGYVYPVLVEQAKLSPAPP